MFTKITKKYFISLFVVTGFLIIHLNVQVQYAVEDAVADEDLTEALARELKYEDAISAYLADVATKNSVVALSGWVDHLLAKEKATEMAKAERGVLAAINDIQVKPVYRDDEEILTDVVTALTLNPAIDKAEVDVGISDGIATSEGTAASRQERVLTESVVKSVRGIRKVKNRIIIKPKQDRPDAELAKEIRSFLDMDVWIDAGMIDVNVVDGVVILKGDVGSATEKAVP